MHRFGLAIVLLFATFVRAQVQMELQDWHDAAREREVPVKIYVPAGNGPAATVLLSHGLGGTRDAMGYLATAWAEHGYLVVVLQHHGSDDAVWRDVPPIERLAAMRKAAMNLEAIRNRPADVSFAIDHLLAERQAGTPLGKRFDADRIAVAGHSFGAFTALAVAGQRNRIRGEKPPFEDDRIKAAIALSPPKAMGDPAFAFGAIRMPLLTMTGTNDTSAISPDTKATDRRQPFENTPAGVPSYLVTLIDGDHMVFGGDRGGHPPAMHQAIIVSSITFLDAYLRDHADAREKLTNGDLKTALTPTATFEMRN